MIGPRFPCFGERAAAIWEAWAHDRDEFTFSLLGDHMEEVGQPEFARMIRDREFYMFRDVVSFLEGARFDPDTMRLHFMHLRWVGVKGPVKKWVARRSFASSRGRWTWRIGIYREQPTPLFHDQFA